MDQLTEALDDYQTILKLDPGNAKARAACAVSSFEHILVNDYDKFIERHDVRVANFIQHIFTRRHSLFLICHE